MHPHTPLFPQYPHLIHGADYNPEQWLEHPEMIDRDFELFKEAGLNSVSIGIFSWSMIEPREGAFEFRWMDSIMDRLENQEMKAVLATPSGARPPWLAHQYPEVLRVAPNGRRQLWGGRHNHCYTSPVYRDMTARINGKLAERYGKHPALLVWHLSNEYSGECHCELCQAAFRQWLKNRYNDDLDALNHAYWSRFWSHVYTDWEQIQSPSPHGESQLHGLNLDWHRFVTHQTADFMNHEIKSIRAFSADVPVTTNFMALLPDLDYWRLAPSLDIISWDSYPQWHRPGGMIDEPAFQAMLHEQARSMKGGQPFLLMECSPSISTWHKVARQKRPGMHLAASMQAIAHGSESVQYFQWRASRGGCEKFHGAVIEHGDRTDAKTFRDVVQTGQAMANLKEVAGSRLRPEVALVFDWEVRWALDDSMGFKKEKGYVETVFSHYKGFWKQGIAVDVVESQQDFSPYKVVLAPMLYLLRKGVPEALKAFVRNGGTVVLTYFSGMVDENDLCFLGGFPGPLKDLCGIWAEEIDSQEEERHALVVNPESGFTGLTGTHETRDFCTRIHLEGAEAMATYQHDSYAGFPALTRNRFGKGEAWYLAARTGQGFIDAFYKELASAKGLAKPLQAALPEGVSVTARYNGSEAFLFLLNFSGTEQALSDSRLCGKELISGEGVEGTVRLPAYGAAVVKLH